ncbi:hypothetical protein ACWAUC_10645 [Bradyrhizobium guangdongense]
MSKKPMVAHKYHPKKDRLEITVKDYALEKKADREQIILRLLESLERSPALAIANAKASKKSKKLAKTSKKESKVPVTGD